MSERKISCSRDVVSARLHSDGADLLCALKVENMAKRRQQWTTGDHFIVPLRNGSFAQGQIVIPAADAMNSVVCVFSSNVYSSKPELLHTPKPSEAIAILFVTRDFLDSGRWEVLNNEQNLWSAECIGFDEFEKKGFVGAKIIGSANVEALLNAFNGLEAWNAFHDPSYLDRLLLNPDRKPSWVLLV